MNTKTVTDVSRDSMKDVQRRIHLVYALLSEEPELEQALTLLCEAEGAVVGFLMEINRIK